MLIIACVVVILAIGVYIVRGNLDRTAGPTVASTIPMLEDVNSGKTLNATVSQTTYGYYVVIALIASLCGLLYVRFKRSGWL